ncbi:MAG: PadR family transcriptional regulator [Chloroflexi bacterium]|nr:PadR family transcriptional regulator [Chloroflexota bacterium]
MLKYVLLGGLNYRPLTGYQLKQWVDQTTRHFWHAHSSQVYRTLDSLEKSSLARSEIQEQDNRPDRRLYHITSAGRNDLLAWLAQPMTEIEPTKDALIVRLFFSAQLDKATVLMQLHLQRALHQQQLDVLRGDIVEQIAAGRADNPDLARDALMWEIARRNGELMEEAYIRWLDEAIARIEAEFDVHQKEGNSP